MIIINSTFQQGSPVTLCTIAGKADAAAFLVGPAFIRSIPLPELTNGFWIISHPGNSQVRTIKINEKLYFESSSLANIPPGSFIADKDNQLLIIKPYD
jgi:hypothetical protein